MDIFKGDLIVELGKINDRVKEMSAPVSDDCPVQQSLKLKEWSDVKAFEDLLKDDPKNKADLVSVFYNVYNVNSSKFFMFKFNA